MLSINKSVNMEIKAKKIGRSFAVDKQSLIGSIDKLDIVRQKEIAKVVKDVLKDYGDVIKRLGND